MALVTSYAAHMVLNFEWRLKGKGACNGAGALQGQNVTGGGGEQP